MSAKQMVLMDARAIERTLRRMAEEIVEVNAGTENIVLVGIQRRGVQLAERIAAMIQAREGNAVPLGTLDITLYRDDLQTVGPRPVVGPTNLPWNLEGRRVIIVDDVLFTGRTIRAALDELTDFGRAARIELAVLIDRGGRELPIHADFIGRKVEIGSTERVDVQVQQLDGADAVVIASRAEPSPR
jgi:pyrimidine operon attenuation protein/uracil phosphoribosyltransferase